MKKHRTFKQILIIVLCFFIIVFNLSSFLVGLFETNEITQLYAEYYSLILLRTSIILISISLIYKNSLQNFNGFSNWFNLRYIQVWIGLAMLAVLATTANQDLFENEIEVLTLFLISTTLIAFAEEFVFRGLILPLSIRLFSNQSKAIMRSIIFSATIFGISHYINFIKQPTDFIGVTNQVIMATSMAIVFSIIIIRLQNLLIVSFLHALINITLNKGLLNEVPTTSILSNIDFTTQIKSTVFPLVLLFTSIVITYLASRKMNVKSILQLESKG